MLTMQQERGSTGDIGPNEVECAKSSEFGRHLMQPKLYTSCQKNATDLVKRKSGGAKKLFRKRRSLQSTNGFLLDDGGAHIAVQCGIHSNIDFSSNTAGSSCSWPFSANTEIDITVESSSSDSSNSPGEERVVLELNRDVCCLYCPPVVLSDGHLRSRSANSVHYKAHACTSDPEKKVKTFLLEPPGTDEITVIPPEDDCSDNDDDPSAKKQCISRFKPIYEGDILVCRSAPFAGALGKLLWTRVFKRWESCRLKFFSDRFTCQSNATAKPTELSTFYSDIRHIQIFPTKEKVGESVEPGRISRPCIRIALADHQILLQAKNSHICCQWFYTLHWRNRLAHGRLLLLQAETFDQFKVELISLVEYVILCRISHEEVKVSVLEVLNEFLRSDNKGIIQTVPITEVVNIVQPLLLCVENYILPNEMCKFLSRFFIHCPSSNQLLGVFVPLIQQLLKHNSDFGKRPEVRDFIADFFLALMSFPNFEEQVDIFVAAAHGPTRTCPHIRVLSNLVAVCLASLQLSRKRTEFVYDGIRISKPIMEKSSSNFEDRYSEGPSDIGDVISMGLCNGSENDLNDSTGNLNDVGVASEAEQKTIKCFLTILKSICRYEDWRYSLAPLLQPIPFGKSALICDTFVNGIEPIIASFAQDRRCEVHTCVLGVRDGKLGWFHLFAPGGLLADDANDGNLFCTMLSALINCCYKRKKFILYLSTYFLSPILLLASKGNTDMMDLLCLMLQLEILDTADVRVEVISTLESSKAGHERYSATCEEISKFKELQSKGGPTMLSLPPKSSDHHLLQVLQSGYFGNLESLSLAFTNITSQSGHLISKLRSLKYLNLWGTHFGDQGLQLVADNLLNLQVLNLCETPVSDKGLASLVHIKSLRRLNLNSTKLTAHTFEILKKELPLLQEVDIRYTDAW